MRRIAHISDLHFGRIDPAVVNALLAELSAHALDLVIVSGDLTQRARPAQFTAAREFLDRLPVRHMVIPGNHDLPVYNLFARFTDPLRLYRRHISRDLNPVLDLGDVAVLGLNTTRSFILDFAEGRVNMTQMRRVQECLGRLSPDTFKIVFTHHPFLPPPDKPKERLVGRARLALTALERAGVDLLLAGHLHKAYSGDVMDHHAHVTRSILVAQASTATSTRLRAEPNAFNIIEVDGPFLTLKVHSWEGAKFMPGPASRWERRGERWHKLSQDTGLAEMDARLARQD